MLLYGTFISAVLVVGSLTGSGSTSGIGPELRDAYAWRFALTDFALCAELNAFARSHNDDRDLTETERALLVALRSVMQSPEIRRVSLDEIRRQMEFNPPVAFIDGYWVTPVDLSRLIGLPQLLNELRPLLSADSAATAVLDRPELARTFVALAFTSRDLSAEMKLPYVGRFPRLPPPDSAGVFVVTVKDSDWVVNEYLPPVASEADSDCYYFCGDANEWDFDSDGLPNHADPDDDNDSVPDGDDAFPYFTGESIGPPGAQVFIGFTEKFTKGVVDAVISARDSLRSSELLTVGVVADGARVSMAFPEVSSASTDPCKKRDLSGVRFVSTDVLECARIRFRCNAGETGFSDECGCGCVAAD